MSNLRHWRASTTSATSSSTSATRRVAVAEELLRDLSKLGPLGLCATPWLLAGVCPRGCRSGLYHGWVRWRKARRIALQIHALRRWAKSTSGRNIRALSGGPAVLASCPADRLRTILRALAGSARLCQALAGSGRLWRLWQALAGSGRLWQALAGSGRLWQALAGSGRLWQALAGSGRL